MPEPKPCPICLTPNIEYAALPLKEDIGFRYECPTCGSFRIHTATEHFVLRKINGDPIKSAILSHSLRKMQLHTEWPIIYRDIAKQILNNNRLPSPAEQAENLIIWLGDTSDSPGDKKDVFHTEQYRSIIGAVTNDNFTFILNHLTNDGLIQESELNEYGTCHITLTFEGWQQYEELKRGASQSRKAFMAMKSRDDKLDTVFQDYFKPAVGQTGFDLVRLDEEPKAGSILDRLRIEIRTSRFIISDLTYGNNGAYWEAGYAEGLRKPVIYTCEQAYFDEHGTHFDTKQLHTVMWNLDDMEEAVENLKVTIRAALPDEAKLTD